MNLRAGYNVIRIAAGLVALTVLPSAAIDWANIILPKTDSSEGSTATGSAAARGIDDEQTAARSAADVRSVQAIETIEPEEKDVALFCERGGLKIGTAPGPKPQAPQQKSGGPGFGQFIAALDPTGYAAPALGTMEAIKGFSLEEEIELGRRIAGELFTQFGRYDDRSAVTYLNLVAATVGRNSDRPELHYHVGVLNSPEVNAFSAPGGYLFVTRGVLGIVEDEAELGGILAHEVAHVSERHILTELRRSKVLGGALSVARTRGFSAAQYAELSGFATGLLSKGLSRSDELAADAKGAEFAARAGYGKEGLLRFLQRLEQSPKAKGMVLFRTHPAAADRIAAFSAGTAANGVADNRLAERFRRFVPAR